jgi:hypothetical protein
MEMRMETRERCRRWEKKEGAREKRNRGEREIELPKDLCVILGNCRDLSVKYNFSSI